MNITEFIAFLKANKIKYRKRGDAAFNHNWDMMWDFVETEYKNYSKNS